MRKFLAVLLCASVLGVMGCAAPCVNKSTEGAKIVNASMERTHQAVINAFSVLGFNIMKDEANYVQGVKPRKMGFFVGSGGERVGVWLEKISDTETKVIASTAKTYVGMAGQKRWEEQLLQEIENDLSGK